METTPNTKTLPPKIRDLFGYNAAIADEELSFATARCIYALDRRHRLQERVMFGSLALNSAALLALLSMAGGEHGKLTALGIGSDTVATGTALFIIGAILAGLAIWVSTNHFIEVTGLVTCPPGFHQHELESGSFVAHERGLSNGLRSGARRA